MTTTNKTLSDQHEDLLNAGIEVASKDTGDSEYALIKKDKKPKYSKEPFSRIRRLNTNYKNEYDPHEVIDMKTLGDSIPPVQSDKKDIFTLLYEIHKIKSYELFEYMKRLMDPATNLVRFKHNNRAAFSKVYSPLHKKDIVRRKRLGVYMINPHLIMSQQANRQELLETEWNKLPIHVDPAVKKKRKLFRERAKPVLDSMGYTWDQFDTDDAVKAVVMANPDFSKAL